MFLGSIGHQMCCSRIIVGAKTKELVIDAVQSYGTTTGRKIVPHRPGGPHCRWGGMPVGWHPTDSLGFQAVCCTAKMAVLRDYKNQHFQHADSWVNNFSKTVDISYRRSIETSKVSKANLIDCPRSGLQKVPQLSTSDVGLTFS